jgi:hypothetical protein
MRLKMPHRGRGAQRPVLQGRFNYKSRRGISGRFPALTALGSLLIGLWSGGAIAWGAMAYYPTSVTPAMPDEAQAKQIAVQPPAVFRTLSHAHQTAMDRGWKGIGAVFNASGETVVE